MNEPVTIFFTHSSHKGHEPSVKTGIMSTFDPIEQVRTADKVLAQLKRAILSGRFVPGEKMSSERELMQEFKVSRVVIREAIRALELTGFVNIKQGQSGGIFINDLTYEFLSNTLMDLFLADKLSAPELMKVRLHIEPEIARLAALNGEKDHIDELKEALEKEQRPNAHHSELVEANFTIHYMLAKMCGNRLFCAIAFALLKWSHELVLVVKPDKKNIHDHKQHVDLVEAVINGDAEKAHKLMTDHLSGLATNLAKLDNNFRKHKGLK